MTDDAALPATPPVPVRPPSNTLAVIALIFSFLPFCWLPQIAAIVMAVIHLAQPRERTSGRRLAVAAIPIAILVGLAQLGGLILIGVAISHLEAQRDAAGTITSGGFLLSTDLRVGDCLKNPSNEHRSVGLIDAVPCSEPHRVEVFAVFGLPAGPYPGHDEVVRMAGDGCAQRFQSYVGAPLSASSLHFTFYYPTSGEWSRDGRDVQCLLVAPHPVTGSLKGGGGATAPTNSI